MLNRKLQTLLLALMIGAASNCSKDADEEAGRPLPPEPHELSTEGCDDPMTTTLLAGPDVVSRTDVTQYAVAAAPGSLVVNLADEAGDELATLETAVELDFTPRTGILSEWRVTTQHAAGGEVEAEQRLRGRNLEGGRIWLEVVHRAGDTSLTQWAVLGADREPVYQAIGVDSTDGRQMVDGRTFDMLEITGQDGETLEPSEVDAWLDARVGDAFSSSTAWNRLSAVGDDLALWNGLDAQARLCDAAAAGDREEALIDRQQAMCPYVVGDERTRRQAMCSTVDNIQEGLQWTLRINDVIGAVGTGMILTTAVVAAGVTSGPVIAAVFIGGAAAHIIVSAKIESEVKENKDSVFDALFTAGGAFTNNPEGGQAAADFFKGDSGKKGGSWGDPHIDTFDGLSYGFQSVGEFVFVRAATGEPLEVQVRQEPRDGICSSVAVNTAVATQVGDVRLAFYAGEGLRVNGTLVEAGAIEPVGDGTLEHDGNDYLVRWPTGDQLGVRVYPNHIDIVAELAGHRQGGVVGLLGDFDGDIADDITTSGGDVMAHPVDWLELRDVFATSWRVEESESLFDYDVGVSTTDFADPAFPARPARVEDLPEDARTAAESACAGVDDAGAYLDCVVDVACTEDEGFVDSHVDRDTGEDLGVVYPIFLDDWTQEGDLSNGDWQVAEDGQSVTQLNNGDPTFFVSPSDFADVTVKGTLRVDGSGDDDIIGFVFGYNSPLEANGDLPDVYDTFVLSWKAQTQSGSEAGFTLARITGEVLSSGYNAAFWEVIEGPGVQVLGRNLGNGWGNGFDFPFELTYTADEIVIVVGGEEIFRVAAADSPVPFAPGRFGFYNYSQQDVTYSDFSVGPPLLVPTASLAGLEPGMDYPDNTYDTIPMEVADPRVCRDLCVADDACVVFVYTRPVFNGADAQCELKDAVSTPVPNEAVISGLRPD